MRFHPIAIFLGVLLLVTGCKSPHAAAPDAAAAVEVIGASELDCAMAIRKVFLRDGFTAKPSVDSRMFVYDKVGNRMDEFYYGGWGMDAVKIRVKINLVGIAAQHFVIAANPYVIRDELDERFAEEDKIARGRKHLQQLLEQVQADLTKALPAPAAN